MTRRYLHDGEAAALKEGQLRGIVLGGQSIEYRLIRARRRSIGMEVHLEGLTVRAPRWVSLRDIEAALTERARWIVRSLAEWRARRRDVMPRRWRTGEQIVFRGEELSLEVFPARRFSVAADLFSLTVRHPEAHDQHRVAEGVQLWLKDQAWALVAARVAHYMNRVSADPPAVRLSDARSEWGSCNAKGEIRLNWRLVQLPPMLAEYVVAHEVAHIVELNHSARFWSVVESLLPGHAALRRQLDDWTALLAA
ncbi:MAG: SprT family zinc-dependent metalloprotease [Casimicrobiaceae bacterium]